METWYFYLARCSDDSLYGGICLDLERRFEQHNAGRGAKYTRGRRPVRLVYAERHGSKSEALKREREVKRWRRERKEALLNKQGPQGSGRIRAEGG